MNNQIEARTEFLQANPHITMTKTLSLDRFTLNEDELAFYKRATGIQGDDELKEHIIDVSRQALEVYPYHCIYTFGFLRCRILRSKISYRRLLELGSTRKNALFLDLGCCFGNDIRKAIEDGYPAQNVIASDLRPDFWKFGHELFKSNPSTLPAVFVPGDVLDETFISVLPPLQKPLETTLDSPQILLQTEPKSLNPLRGHLSAIHTSAFFHLFNKEEQLLIAKKLASLLSPLPGSIIFGSHVGYSQPSEDVEKGSGTLFYRHSPDTWKDMWEREVFDGKGMVKVEAELQKHSESERPDVMLLWWIVIRV